MKPKRIPLFPLDVVLFPGSSLPLHIFEPRYKLMIRRCLTMKLQFGVILAQKQGIATVGCTAAITSLAKQYPDGKMDILTRGEFPFQVKEVFDDKPYYEAAIECLEDAPEAYPAASQDLVETYEQCYWLLYNRGPEITRAAGISPAYTMADSLPLPLDEKQVLLEMRDETQRQAQLFSQLKEWLPQLVFLNERRQRARGNGHSLN
ncbi:MAG TPA: LON peptidase substrate-binding domain-containing protein [Candidatus Acidoferrales bacterium]|nr:LON peptidase substrate-binding domain-containing protein [Candidatus Acidoferrales bacterium]